MEKVFTEINRMVADDVIVDYAIGGAIAASFYIEASATEDVDTFVHIKPGVSPLAPLAGIYEYARAKGFSEKNEFVVIEGWDVQFLVPAEGSIEDEAINSPNIIGFRGQEVRVMMPEYLCAIALDTGRGKDIDRVRAFINQDKANLEELGILVERFGLEKQWEKVKTLA